MTHHSEPPPTSGRVGPFTQDALDADRVQEQIRAFRLAHEALDTVIHDTYPDGRRVRVYVAGQPLIGIVAGHLSPLDAGLIVALEPADFARCQDSVEAIWSVPSTGAPRIVRPWASVSGPVSDEPTKEVIR